MTFEQTLIISILSAVVAGSFAILGVVITTIQNNKQIKMQLKQQRDNKLQEYYDNRPEFEIKKLEPTFEQQISYSDKDASIFNVVLVDGKIINEVPEYNWTKYSYTLNNIGNDIIECVDFFSLHKDVFVSSIDDLKDGGLNKIFSHTGHTTYFKNKIKQNEIFTLNIFVPAYQRICNYPVVSCCLVLKGFNKKLWKQNLYIGEFTIEDSCLLSRSEYIELNTRTTYLKDIKEEGKTNE